MTAVLADLLTQRREKEDLGAKMQERKQVRNYHIPDGTCNVTHKPLYYRDLMEKGIWSVVHL